MQRMPAFLPPQRLPPAPSPSTVARRALSDVAVWASCLIRHGECSSAIPAGERARVEGSLYASPGITKITVD